MSNLIADREGFPAGLGEGTHDTGNWLGHRAGMADRSRPRSRRTRVLASLFILGWPLAIGLFLPIILLLFPDGRPARAGGG